MSTEISTPIITEYLEPANRLQALQRKYTNAVFDTTTVIGMAQAVAARRDIRTERVGLEKLRKELKAPALERSRLIDAEAKSLTAMLEEMEAPIDSQIKAEEARKAEEKAERERIEREKLAALQRRVANIREQAVKCVGKTAEEIAGFVNRLSDFEIDETFGALQAAAHAAKAETIQTLTEMHFTTLGREREAEQLRIEREELEAKRKAQEEQAEIDRAELAKLRAEAAARQAELSAELDRKIAEEAKRAAAVRAEHDAKIAAEEAVRAEEERKAAAIRAEEEAKAKATRDAEQAKLDAQRAEIEEARRKVEAERLAQEEAARMVQSGYDALQSFVDRFGSDKEFQTITRTISKWLDAKKEQRVAA
jgi:hypothetical protein